MPTAVSQGFKCSMASVRGIAVPGATPDSAVANVVKAVLDAISK